MSTTEETLARSLTAESTMLIMHLPYLLQDLWELGSDPAEIETMLRAHADMTPKSKILDLACGKGAVSVRLAKAFGCKVKGVDLLDDFVRVARDKAAENKVKRLCVFECADVNDAVMREKGYDVVVFGAAGDVLGTPQQMLANLKKVLKKGGYAVLDDAYATTPETDYKTLLEWHAEFEQAGFDIVEQTLVDLDRLAAINTENQLYITKRADELKRAFPEKANLFQGYVDSQQAECDDLAGALQGVTWLLKAR